MPRVQSGLNVSLSLSLWARGGQQTPCTAAKMGGWGLPQKTAAKNNSTTADVLSGGRGRNAGPASYSRPRGAEV